MKKALKLLGLLSILAIISSCSPIRVAADYDSRVDFDSYKTFAFFKPGIDQAEISDLDKRRILRAIETELMNKGYTKSENPDLLISIFTKAKQRVDVYNNAWGGGWGWGPGWGWGGAGWAFGGPGWGWGWGGSQVSTSTEGVLFIDFLDANKKELIWQGSGEGSLITKDMSKKEERIKLFVSEMMTKFPPEKEDN